MNKAPDTLAEWLVIGFYALIAASVIFAAIYYSRRK